MTWQHVMRLKQHAFRPAKPPRSRTSARAPCFSQSGFLVAECDGEIVGFVNSGASDQDDLADESLKDMVGHDPSGRNLVVFSVAVQPSAQGQGVATQLLPAFIEQARLLGKESVLLLCKAHLVGFYERFGFQDEGLSNSVHGGARWHTMRRDM